MTTPGKNRTRWEDLAVFGASPAFGSPLHVGRPNIGDRVRLLERINGVLDRAWLTNDGPCVKEFEQRVAALVGVRHCIAVCNATTALEIAIRALDLSGEVIVPSFTFIATAHALQWQAIAPVFADVDPVTHNLDPRAVERAITPRTTGILGVHVWGRPCAVDALAALAQRRGLKLLFDAAHAFGCSSERRMLGGFGDAEVFSFHATKVLNSFEGGAIVTNNDDVAHKLRMMRNFGFADYDRVVHIGVNGKMTEVCAAMGLTSLESLDDFIARNHGHYQHYRRELDGLPGVSFVAYDEGERNNYHYVVLLIDDAQTRISRDRLIEVLHAENVLARRYFYPGCHRMEPYRSCFPTAGSVLPATERLVQQVLCLPSGSALGPDDVRTVSSILRLAIEKGPQVSAALDRAASSNHGHT